MRTRRYLLRDGSAEPFPSVREVADPSVAGPRVREDAPWPAEGPLYTVSEITQRVQALFQEAFAAEVWVQGELSDPKIYPSGHLWFDLKDEQAVLKSVMWRDHARRLRFEPKQGLQVICAGRVEFYPRRGEVKFSVRVMEPKGIGALQLAFEQLKERLQKEGLFAEERKRDLPAFPAGVGIVTSPQGAAIDDILKVLEGAGPAGCLRVALYPSRVQGLGAAEAIARGIRELNALGELDLLIVGRGGGSLEDLWAFNEEPVARAIFQSRLPVISAVGHEKDVTISDLVADVRAPTPTRAAELVLAQRRAALDRLFAALEEPAFAQPEEWLAELGEKIADLAAALLEGVERPLVTAAHRVQVLHGELLGCSPQAVILHQAERLHRLHGALITGTTHALELAADRVHALAGRLHALSPLAVLARGYSITFDDQGRILKLAGVVKPGEVIRTKLHRGEITSRVES